MAHKKGVGSSDNGRDSKSKRLGVKLFGGQSAKAGNIIIRQRGTKYKVGQNVYLGKDYTVHASIDGQVQFTKTANNRTVVHVMPFDAPVAETVAKIATKKQAPQVEKSQNPTAQAVAKPASKSDDLKKIEGVGPKIAEILNGGGILSFADLAKADIGDIKNLLDAAGPRYQMHDPTSWPQQAQLAAAGKWDELEVLQDKLDGGRIVSSEEE